MTELRLGLIAYGIRRMAETTGGDADSLVADCLGQKPPELNAQPFEALLGQHDTSDGPLRAVLSLVRFAEEAEQEPTLAYYRPRKLALDEEAIFPKASSEAAACPDLSGLWEEFAGECRQALRQDDDRAFLRFTHLLRKYAWALPCTYGEAGVSLFEQFKAVAALVFASRSLEEPADEYLLVGGDIPGIQDFIYTITSKGAAKGLRGRSFFIQLLGDAVVRRLCHDLGLSPEVSVIYAAGGNFMLLAPRQTVNDIEQRRQEINRKLLETFGGDLFLCLAVRVLSGDEIGSGAFATRACKAVKQAIAGQKRQRFREEAREKWELIFGPQGKGGDRYCAVCQRELGAGEGIPIEEDFIPPQGPSLKCNHCAQFEALAGDIAHDDLLFAVSLPSSPQVGSDWQMELWRLTGVWYDFRRQTEALPAAASVYVINCPDFRAAGADGFLFLGNATPRAERTIKTFGEMAEDAAGVKRVGVLRMDVDDLGRVMIGGLERRTMALTSALSGTLELFFGGWLNTICEEVQQSSEILPKDLKARRELGDQDLLYIIYSGGDDLFIVGTWDRLPLLAEHVHNDFAAFTGRNPHLHISAGLTLERRKFPLYRAAEQALDALDNGAKAYVRPDGGRKDAVTFLDQTVAWDDFAPSERGRFGVKEGARRLVDLVDQGVPRSLLQMVQSIYGQYLRDIERNRSRRPSCEPPDEQLYYGRWMWMQAYQIQRLVDRHKDEGVKRDIRQLQADLMCRERVCYSGLAARWAEYLTRKERQDGE